MRAVVCREVGERPEIQITELPDPRPGPGHVLVRVAAAALNYPDLLMMRGTYQHKPSAPFVPGMEAAGEIVAVGEGSDPAWLGREVAVATRTGCFAEFVSADRSQIVMDVPSGWSMAEAAAFPVATKTAYHALVQRAALKSGETVVITGATGGTGHMAIKLARALGARVVATTGSSSKRDALAQLGADHVVVASAEIDFAAALKAACGPAGADVVFDPVGGPVLDSAMRACGYGARVCVVGFTAGAPTSLRSNYILIKGLSILGIRAGETSSRNAGLGVDFRAALPRLTGAMNLRPSIHASYPLDRAAEAFETLERREVVGKLVLSLA